MLGIEILGVDPRQQDGALAGVDLDPVLGGANLQVVEVEPGDLEPDPVLVRVEIGDVVVAVIGAEDETVAPLATLELIVPGAALQPVAPAGPEGPIGRFVRRITLRGNFQRTRWVRRFP